ncbi:MAG: phage tail tube protein [Candidatus Hodarchaeales archaeon]
MSIKIGRQGWVGVAFETSPGTGGTTPVKYIPYNSCTLHNVVEVIDDEAAKGIRERAWGSVAARTRGEGDIAINVDVENLPYLLIPALGTCYTSEVESGVYEHVITRKSSNPPTTICLNVNDTVETRRYAYGVVNTLELTFSDGLVTATAGILSKAPEAGSGTPSITEENVLAFKDAKIYFGSTLAEAENKAATDTDAVGLTAFTLTINNNAEAQYESGSSSPAQISLGQFELGGNYTLFFEDTTERAAHENQTKRAMVVVFTGSSIGTSSTEKIQISIPQFHITERSIDTSPAGFVTENPTFVGDYDSTYGSIIVKIWNQTGTTNYTCCTLSSSSSSSSSSSTSSSSSSSSSG